MDDGRNVERMNKEKRRGSVSGRDEGTAESIGKKKKEERRRPCQSLL